MDYKQIYNCVRNAMTKFAQFFLNDDVKYAKKCSVYKNYLV